MAFEESSDHRELREENLHPNQFFFPPKFSSSLIFTQFYYCDTVNHNFCIVLLCDFRETRDIERFVSNPCNLLIFSHIVIIIGCSGGRRQITESRKSSCSRLFLYYHISLLVDNFITSININSCHLVCLQKPANSLSKHQSRKRFKNNKLHSRMAPSLTDLHELKSFVVDEGHGVKGLSELKIKTLPDLFIQPLEKRLDMSKVAQQESIPVIDMSNSEDPEVMKSICDAAENWGFFQIVNHGVPISVLDDVKEATHRFFALPAHEKKKYLFKHSPTKNVRLVTSFIPEVDKVLEWKDYLSCFYVSDDQAMAFWPSVCRDEVLEYMNKSESLIKRLLEVLIKGLGIPKLDETSQPFLMGSRRINLNYYPICPNPELTVGVGGHSDVSTLTVLLQDETGGLYVRKLHTDNWVHVPPIKGSLTINIGDALQIMSNGRYKSIEHQVVANGHENRISVPLFVNPRPSDVIGPLAEVIKRGEKALYKQVLYSDYVKHFYKKSHNGKDTIDYAKY